MRIAAANSKLIFRLASRHADDRRGASAVEFALVVPVLLMLLFGICIYGLYLGAAHNLRSIAAEAASASVAGVSDDERASLARQRIDTAMSGSMFRPGSIDVQVGADPSDATLYNVTLSVDAKTLGFSGFAKIVPMPPDVLRSTVSVRRGGL